jgi:nitrogen fixation/metabolism regulation signal transduction histidine kinase
MRERESLRAELELSERRHREVIESVPAFVLALDAQERIVLLNRRFEEFTGYSREELLGTPATGLVGSNTDQRLSLKSGEQRVIRWRLAPLERPDAAGAATYAVGVDVTDEKDLERRTRTAERLAALGTLAAGLAHEVRNPLNSASLQLQVLNRRLQKHPEALEQCSPIVDVVRSEIQRLDHLVSDFLAFARPRPLDR